jgi:hypothetical protein
MEPEAPAATPPAPAGRRSVPLASLAKLALFLVGVGALVGLVREAGPARVWAVLRGAGPWLPLVMVLEAVCVAVVDALVIRTLLAHLGVSPPLRPTVRSTLLAYSAMVFLPAGRTGAEVVRAAVLSKHAGVPMVAACATHAQGVTLLATALVSLPCAVAVGLVAGPSGALTLACFGNAAVCAVLGLVFLLGPRLAMSGGALGARLKARFTRGGEYDAALRRLPTLPLPALALSFVGRVLQTVQYGVVLHAVGGSFGAQGALVAQGIHLVGAAAGDMVPNQAGILEGAYRLFADALGFASDPAKAVSIALVVRLSQVALGAVSAPVSWLASEREAEASSPGRPAATTSHPSTIP